MNGNSAAGFSLDLWAKRQPEKTAFYMDDRSISYGELQARAACLAAALRRFGLRPPDHVLLFLPNCMAFPVAFFAAAELGLHIVPANALLKIVEIRQILDTLRPRLAFVADEAQERLLRAADGALPVARMTRDGALRAALPAPAAEPPASAKRPGEPCTVVSTSGSTGAMKLVARSYQDQITPARSILRALRAAEEDVFLIPLPLAQHYGLIAMLCGCAAGGTMVVPGRFEAPGALREIERHGVTVQFGVPTMYAKEIAAYEQAEPKPDIRSLRTGMISGASSSTLYYAWFEAHAGCRLLNSYGATEIAAVTMTDYDDWASLRHGTCGRSFPYVTLEIVDEHGRVLPAGSIGEIVCKTPCAMREYVGAPQRTEQAFDRQGRFLTGDIGRLDSRGFLTVCGRRKDLMIRGGYNVFPAELEAQLLKDPRILEACVLGHKNTVLGEEICAFVKLREGAAEDAPGIRASLGQRIAKYKLPDRIIFLPDIPRLANGKSDYLAMAALLDRPRPQ